MATRAAVLAGYEEDKAASQGSRLLKNPLVLTRIAALRAERNLRHVLDADAIQDKLEAVFFEALGDRDHSAAVSALRLQAGLARLPTRPAPAADDGIDARAEPPRRGARKAEKSR